MELKKNPKKDLTRNSGVYFAFGMAFVLALTYIALEWKSFYNNEIYNPDGIAMENELDEDAPIFILETLPPPSPPVAPDVIEIIKDDDLKEESPIESTEVDETTEIMEVKDVEYAEEPEDIAVIFSVIEDVPVFPGCENEKDKRACFNTMMRKHIVKNFRYPELEQEMGIQGRVNVMFEIQKDGSIAKIRMRGPNKNLEKDAARIISKLPKMTPGKQRGNPVRVPFSIPITYKLSN